MARLLRIEFAGALYHIMSRGNERQAIVRDDADRDKRLDWLRRTVPTYGWRLHVFVLMGHHEHLFVETHNMEYQGRLRPFTAAGGIRPVVYGGLCGSTRHQHPRPLHAAAGGV